MEEIRSEYYDYAEKLGIESGAAYKHLFVKHFHEDSVRDGESLVTQEEALNAIRIAEEELKKKYNIK
jgi:hypothetical protein